MKFYKIVKFKNVIWESSRIDPLASIFLSALLRNDTSDNAIKAIQMRSK